MKTLYLLRHAKADRSNPAVSDYDRPLSDRGTAAARCIGRAMGARGWVPQMILCSAARRAVETWEAVEPELTASPSSKNLSELYLAPPTRLLSILRHQPNGVAAILLVGHNPGIASVVNALAGPKSATPAIARLGSGYPTATLGLVSLDIDAWTEIGGGESQLSHLLYPSDPT